MATPLPQIGITASQSPPSTRLLQPSSQTQPSLTSPTTHHRPSSHIHTHTHHDTVPLSSPLRTTPIHPSLSLPLLPSTALSTNTNPLTLQPFTPSELSHHHFPSLQTSLIGKSKDDVQTMIEEEITKLKAVVDERERKEREVDREMGEKERVREVERRVYRRKMGI